MIKIEVDNSYSRVTGLSPAQEKELREAFSYTVGGSSAYFSGYGIRRKSLLDKKGYFPTGLLYKLCNYGWQLTAITQDNRIKPSIREYCLYEPTDYQWQIEAGDCALMYCRGIISAPTGTGKSRAMELLANSLNLKTLIVVPSIEIKKQLSLLFKNNKKVTVDNVDSKALLKPNDYECLIIDEAHHVAAKTYQKLNKTAWTNIYYRFFFTATPFRNDNEETLLFKAIAGDVIYSLSYEDAVKKKYIVPVEGYYVEVPKQKTDAYTYPQVYKELVVNNTPRNVLIAKLLTNLHSASKSTLCLVKEVEHGRILADLTGLPFINGEDEDSRKYIRQFNTGGIMAVIATEGIMSEGVDTKPCEYVVIAGSGKAKSNFMQKVGRAVRNYPGKESAKVIIFSDKSHKFLSGHYYVQRGILKNEYKTVCVKLEIK